MALPKVDQTTIETFDSNRLRNSVPARFDAFILLKPLS
jgi:hypothetical protein